MKKLGLIGGTSWHSTIEYYRNINQAVNQFHGNNTNPPLILYNQNQALIHRYQIEDNWQAIAELFIEAGICLQKAGAASLLFCANTPHKVYDLVSKEVNIPIIHIVDATAQVVQNNNCKKVGFIGTRFSMEEQFIKDRFAQQNIEVLVPQHSSDIIELHRIIQKELTFGNIKPESKQYILKQIDTMVQNGAEGIVLGCTEFPLMISQADLDIPVFDTTQIHAEAAVHFILQNQPWNLTS